MAKEKECLRLGSKAKIKAVLASFTVAMVAYYVTKITTTHEDMVDQYDIKIVYNIRSIIYDLSYIHLYNHSLFTIDREFV